MKRLMLFVTLSLCLGASEALAVIGRPLTPLSYAGVARRTTRRAVYAGAAATTAAAATMATLPAGCVRAGPYYQCGTSNYQPVYDGPDVVYIQVD